MKFKDLKIGQHVWLISKGKILIGAKFDNYGYEVCGAWECGIDKDDCEIIELIKAPRGHKKTKLYYG